MKRLRALVVDDSAYNRRTISRLLDSMPTVDVIGKANDGDEALRKVADLKPDLVTLDLEMPRMDGFTFLRILMARTPTPVIVVSGYSAKENVFRALELGALDFVAKPTRAITSNLDAIEAELTEKVNMVRHLSPAGLDPARRGRPLATQTSIISLSGETEAKPAPVRQSPATRLVVIGASTGGPTALVEMFGVLPSTKDTAFVVAQHMPERFTRTFAERLDRLGALQVIEADGTAPLLGGHGYICPGGRCGEIVQQSKHLSLRITEPKAGDRFVPSVDRLFVSAAKACDQLLAVVLTGMGDDGAVGVVDIKAAGGTVLAEAPETAVIYGMPGAAVRTGHVDKSLPLRRLAESVARWTQQ